MDTKIPRMIQPLFLQMLHLTLTITRAAWLATVMDVFASHMTDICKQGSCVITRKVIYVKCM